MKATSMVAVLVMSSMVAAAPGYSIINGQVDTGWAAVGVVIDDEGNMGSAVLIDPYWVLTSATYVSASGGGWFRIGTDYTQPDAIHAIAEVFPHPFHDPGTYEYDLALARLATPAYGVTPLRCLSSASALFPGANVLYVGYGWSSPTVGDNTVRRSCWNQVSELYGWSFVTLYNGAGPYLGDIGGPALLNVGGEWFVAGLISATLDEGTGPTVAARVSSYLGFIAAVVTANPPPSGVAAEPRTVRELAAAPNPFNPATDISFALDHGQFCCLAVHDTKGRKVADLAAAWFAAGRHTVRWDGRTDAGSDAPSGVYFVVLREGGRAVAHKVALVR